MRKIKQKRAIYLDRFSSRVIYKRTVENKCKKIKRQKKIKDVEHRLENGQSLILDLIINGRQRLFTDKSFYKPIFPENLSILKNPRATLKLLTRLAQFSRGRKGVSHLLLDQSKVVSCDIAAIALLDIILMEIKDEIKYTKSADLKLEGVIPNDQDMSILVRAIGTPYHLKIKGVQLDLEDRDKLEIFEKRVRSQDKKQSPLFIETRERIAEEFINHISRCLTATKSVEINEKGVTHLSSILAEIINNAEEHAGMTDWSLLGYLNFIQDVPVLEVAMINFGKTISETFLALDRNSYTWDQINPYISQHVGRRLFSRSWSEEDLLTVMALQPNISSKNVSRESTRGAGLTQLLEFFQFIDSMFHGNNAAANMAILSGSTYIFFDGRYELQQSGTRKSIAFNEANDLGKRPNKEYVQHLNDVSFPGTIISIQLPLPVDEAND